MTTTGTVDPTRTISDDELRALVTVETAERLAARAATALENGDTGLVFALLGALVDETSSRTATAVKRQDVSDHIAREAGDIVRARVQVIDAETARGAALDAALADDPLAGHPDGPCDDPDCEVPPVRFDCTPSTGC